MLQISSGFFSIAANNTPYLSKYHMLVPLFFKLPLILRINEIKISTQLTGPGETEGYEEEKEMEELKVEKYLTI